MEKFQKDPEALSFIISGLRQSGKRVVLAPGVFDLLHPGHIKFLQAASAFGDYLVVALQSDESARRNRGAGRPILTADERAVVLGALPFVHYITIFDGSDASNITRRMKPDTLARGHEFTETTAPELAAVQESGGKVIIAGDPKLYSVEAMVAGVRRKPAAKAKE